MPSSPSDLRETFELFRFYRPDVGIKRLLQDTGIEDMSPRQIYQSVHGRPPDAFDAAVLVANYDAMASFIGALSSLEFQENLAAHLLQAFPEKRRLFFVHIPKTAGVDVANSTDFTISIDQHQSAQPYPHTKTGRHVSGDKAYSFGDGLFGHRLHFRTYAPRNVPKMDR